MKNFKVVLDSSSDALGFKDTEFSVAPLKIISDEKEYVDDENLDVTEMVDDLSRYKGKTTTACPSPEDWLKAFGDADSVFCVPITSNLSGSYNAAMIAKADYEEKHPEKRVFILDSLSAGGEILLLAEKLQSLIKEKQDFDEICEEIKAYREKTRLLFTLSSMRNLANNGRVSPFVAKAAGLLDIRVVGKASDEGTLEPLEKCRGEKKALNCLLRQMQQLGFKNGRVKIGHCFAGETAEKFKSMVLDKFPTAEIAVYPLRGLCSFYAEKGGMLIGFEI